MTGAIIGSTLIGAGSSMMSSSSASKSASSAADSTAYAAELQRETATEQLEFQKQQYADWEEIFGPIQENLSRSTQALSPDSFAARGLQDLQGSFSASRKSLTQTLAQRGISDSGVSAAAQAQLEGSRMLGGAQIKAGADETVRQQQLQFLGLGLGQQGALQSGISASYGNLANVYGQQSVNSMNMQQMYSGQAAQANASLGQVVGQGMSSYMTYNALNSPTSNYYTPSGSVNYAAGYYGPNLQ